MFKKSAYTIENLLVHNHTILWVEFISVNMVFVYPNLVLFSFYSLDHMTFMQLFCSFQMHPIQNA